MNFRAGAVAVLLFCGLAWGATQPLGKFSVLTGHKPFGIIFWQLVIGALFLAPFVAVARKPLVLTPARLRFGAVLAVIGTLIPNTAFYFSIARLPSGIMSILISLVPMLAFPLALALGMDRAQPLRFAGLALGLASVALIALPGTSLPDPAMLAFLPVALIGPLFYALEVNYVARRGMRGMDAVQAMFVVNVLGALMALPLALGSGQFITPLRVWSVAEYAIVAGALLHCVAYTAYVWLSARAGPVFAAQCSYVVTVSGVFWAWLFLDERFAASVWGALVLMLAGLALVQPRRAGSPSSGGKAEVRDVRV